MKHEITKAPYTETRVINVWTLDNTETLPGLRLRRSATCRCAGVINIDVTLIRRLNRNIGMV